MSVKLCKCKLPDTRNRRKNKFCTQCGEPLSFETENTPQPERSSNILSRSAGRIYENLRNLTNNGAERNSATQSTPIHTDAEIVGLAERLRRSRIFEPEQREVENSLGNNNEQSPILNEEPIYESPLNIEADDGISIDINDSEDSDFEEHSENNEVNEGILDEHERELEDFDFNDTISHGLLQIWTEVSM